VYGLQIPADSNAGDVLELPLHQELGPDEADRFAIALSTKPLPTEPGSVYLFELTLSLRNDGPNSDLAAGRALIALPELPTVGEYYWGTGTAEMLRTWSKSEHFSARQMWGESMPCWRTNTHVLRRALSVEAVRSSNLNQIAAELATPSFAAIH
jgi:hypothetical protein